MAVCDLCLGTRSVLIRRKRYDCPQCNHTEVKSLEAERDKLRGALTVAVKAIGSIRARCGSSAPSQCEHPDRGCVGLNNARHCAWRMADDVVRDLRAILGPAYDKLMETDDAKDKE